MIKSCSLVIGNFSFRIALNLFHLREYLILDQGAVSQRGLASIKMSNYKCQYPFTKHGKGNPPLILLGFCRCRVSPVSSAHCLSTSLSTTWSGNINHVYVVFLDFAAVEL